MSYSTCLKRSSLQLLIACSFLALCVNTFRIKSIGVPKSFISMMSSTSAVSLMERVSLYNTLSRKKEQFKPLEPNKVKFYSCGPTVYDFAHVGNFRAFLTYDILKRWLQYCGFEVDHVCNLTDIDDKIIAKMKKENASLTEITTKFTNAFFEDLDVLNIKRANRYPKATEHLEDIKNMIQTLMDKGFAYEEAGSVYFRVSAFSTYGKLSKLESDEMKDGAGGSGPNARRGTNDKENSRDFVLWKARTNDDDSGVLYDMPWGRGRPGWHIECSAMAYRLLGPTIDLHAGGVDLVFPHHDNEIAQSEAFSGKSFCNCWVHNGFVNIDNEKMSKSLKNFKTLRDIARGPDDARAYRMMVISAQYRSPLNFNADTLTAAANSLKRIDKLVSKLENSMLFPVINEIKSSFDCKSICTSIREDFESAMCDDLNTPRAMSALFKLVSEAESVLKKGSIEKETAEVFLNELKSMDRVLGISYEVPKSYFSTSTMGASLTFPTAGTLLKPEEIPVEISRLISSRALYKSQKQYAEADSIRQRLVELGYELKDGKDGIAKVFFTNNT